MWCLAPAHCALAATHPIGGTLQVRSTPEQGTTFTVSLPLYRNVCTHMLKQDGPTDVVLRGAEDLLVQQGIAQKGDMIVVTWGAPMGKVGGTNALRIVKVGEFTHRADSAR